MDSAHPTASRGTAAHQVVESGEAEEANFELRLMRLLLARLACVVVVLRRTERSPWRNIQIRYDTIRYDTRCCFNVRSEVGTSQLNLPHGNDN